jgi:8-oxo-dGTP pyrophosphatase MutT (NUDIX family)
VPRQTVQLLLVDPDERLLLLHARDPATGVSHWCPVGGGVEPGESLQEAAAREAWEETGLDE